MIETLLPLLQRFFPFSYQIDKDVNEGLEVVQIVLIETRMSMLTSQIQIEKDNGPKENVVLERLERELQGIQQ